MKSVHGEERHEECDCCGFHTKLTFYDDGCPTHKGGWFCDFCAGTLASEAHNYPNMEDAGAMKAICYVGNVLLDRMKEIEESIEAIKWAVNK